MNTTPVELYTNFATVPKQVCASTKHNRTVNVSATFSPAFCGQHKHEDTLRCGWGYLSLKEAQIISMLREANLIDSMHDHLSDDQASGLLAQMSIQDGNN